MEGVIIGTTELRKSIRKAWRTASAHLAKATPRGEEVSTPATLNLELCPNNRKKQFVGLYKVCKVNKIRLQSKRATARLRM